MSRPFDENSTTDDVIAGIDLAGKVVVVTGGSAGLGLEAGRCLAVAGARVVMVARDIEKLDAALAPLREQYPQAQFETEQTDLADLSSVRAGAQRLRERFPLIHLLIDNAGVMACPLARTADGFEMQFGTNHLGHFLFTCLLVPCLLEAAPARVVVLSSAGHKFGDIDFEDPNYERREYDKWGAYGQAKSANALFALALNQRLQHRGVTANAVHPGMIVTELGRHLQPEDIEALQARASAGGEMARPHYKSIEEGSATSVWAATSPELEGRGGLYLEDCQVGEPGAAGEAGGYAPHIRDADNAERLWALSEQLVGDHFDWA
jgi:NAD(P)-dependent dehydrogenase (short-subunit alcohol dehydrogenase family)